MFCDPGGTCRVSPANYTECAEDGNCGPGQACFLREQLYDVAPTCGFLPVADDGSCPPATGAFNGKCIAGLPCGGSCNAGEVCNIETNRCENPPVSAVGCTETCANSQLMVYSDPEAMLFEGCCEVSCECVSLPPIQEGRWGRFSDLELATDRLFVSAYDATYGDLVVASYDKTTLDRLSFEHVDGVPAGGAVAGDPSGIRGGVEDPGPDVGVGTSLALRDGEPRVTYYDVDNQDLKFAYFDSLTGTWHSSTIDSGLDNAGVDIGNVGRYSDLLIDDSGIPHVFFFADRVNPDADAFGMSTGLMYARANSPTPQSPNDWQKDFVERIHSCALACNDPTICVNDVALGSQRCAIPRDDCPVTCGCNEVCVEEGSNPVCMEQLPNMLERPCDGDCPPNTACVLGVGVLTECLPDDPEGCDPECAEDFTCVETDIDVFECRRSTPFSQIEGLPEGVGLFPSAVIRGGTPAVVYYDRLRHHLRGALANFPASSTTITAGFDVDHITCETDRTTDVGQHPSLVATNDGFAVAFQTDNGQTLSYLTTGPSLLGDLQTQEMVDNGIRVSSVNRVGAFASLGLSIDGTPHIAYADQTENDLYVASRTGTFWNIPELLLFRGAYGTSTRLKIEGPDAFVSTYLREHTDNIDVSRLVIQSLNLPNGP
jgi:hypothetical protein